jgi:hypothetical protein
MSAAALSWVESPLDSEHLFVVPHIHQWDFGHVNKHIVYMGQFDDVPLPPNFSPYVPFLLFHLPPFQQVLQSRIVDSSASASWP